MTCKECIHSKVCSEYVAGLAVARGVTLNQAELETVLECDDCEHFADRSRFVELPKVGIVEVPTPHGRLIDAEAIYNNVKGRCNNCHIRACAICGVTRILNDIRTAPTIIEAEE